ncbi:MAG TPA: adenosylcobalamin-dependent ribonucleoside-diphosphate reductase [Bacteroidales bacterium]|nr:adenosylcobalamin-dependent ribonucleoside-diphosphate reductase [Bacteroidales bacterium]HSA43112.1 adenosylcobalamin-dependent ribonucleoside-diphosphate reductase [Bacteroidales bacterium]
MDTSRLQSYAYEEAMEATTAYFKGDTLAASVWINKYALKDSKGTLYEKSPDDMHWRIAREIARIEKEYPNPMNEDEVYALLKDFRYIVPQGSPMAGIGNNIQIGSLSNCFVIGNDGPSDSYGAIMKTDQEQVQLMKRRGGVGHDLSHIRPYGSPVKNSALSSTGIVPFMERFSNSTREVAQDGRRGALMLSISIKHPDSEAFIDAKLETGKVTGANVSVKITDDFMRAVINDETYTQKYPVNADKPKFQKDIRARDLWNKIVHNAWKSAEPGILFWDTILRESVPDCYSDLGFRTVSTNPCGEIPLCPYDSCRLLAINLYSYVDKPFTGEASFNVELFIDHVQKAMRIMDDIIDLETEKIDKILKKIEHDPEEDEIKRVERNMWLNIRHKTLQGRRTGVGITGEGDMLAALGCRYGTDKATDFSVEIHKTLALEAYRSSVSMARERGAFQVYDAEREKHNPFIQRIREADPALYEEMRTHGRRNIALLTIAPTGTTSLMTQTTSGLEPVFQINYKRRRKVNPNDQNARVSFTDEVGDSWEEYNVFHHKFITWLEVNGYNPDEVAAMDDESLQAVINNSPYYKATANDINWVAKVKMQGAVQKYVDHSISVTVNVPKEVTQEVIGSIYQTAWESGCKGMTVYRDGSRSGVLITNDKKEQEENLFRETKAPNRPKVLEAEVIRFQNDYEKWVAIIGLLNGRPYEIFTGRADGIFLPLWVEKGWVIKNKTERGGNRYDFQFEDKEGYKVTMEGLSRTFDKEFWNYAKLISGILRHGMPLPFVVNVVNTLDLKNDTINTWKNGVARALKKYIPDGTKARGNVCPGCGSKELVYQEGCLVCKSCGDSKCGG